MNQFPVHSEFPSNVWLKRLLAFGLLDGTTSPYKEGSKTRDLMDTAQILGDVVVESGWYLKKPPAFIVSFLDSWLPGWNVLFGPGVTKKSVNAIHLFREHVAGSQYGEGPSNDARASTIRQNRVRPTHKEWTAQKVQTMRNERFCRLMLAALLVEDWQTEPWRVHGEDRYWRQRTRRVLQLGFPSVIIEPGHDGMLIAQPQVPFQPRRLIIPSDFAGGVVIQQILVGKDDHLDTPVPARAFTEVSVGIDLGLPLVRINQTIALRLLNVTGESIDASAMMVGEERRDIANHILVTVQWSQVAEPIDHVNVITRDIEGVPMDASFDIMLFERRQHPYAAPIIVATARVAWTDQGLELLANHAGTNTIQSARQTSVGLY